MPTPTSVTALTAAAVAVIVWLAQVVADRTSNLPTDATWPYLR